MAPTPFESKPEPPRTWRFWVTDYRAMADHGIFGRDARVELIEGEILHITPLGSRHQAVVDRLTRLLTDAVRAAAIVRIQGSVQLNDFSQPQPDAALLRDRGDWYDSALPGPGDILLVAEVMQTSADYDRGVKLPLYARSGIPVLWLVDLEAEQVEVHRDPRDGAYRERVLYERGDVVAVPGVQQGIAIVDLLGPV